MKKLKKIIGLIISFAFGGVVGALSAGTIMELTVPLPAKFVILFAGVFIGTYLQIVLHEAGHLVGGLMSGYKFVSFRVGSFMLVRTDGKLRLKRFSLAGTGGQCLMSPPDMQDGKMPVMLYNIAGPAANIISAVVLGALYFVIPSPAAASVCLVMAVIGGFLGLMNGIPMRGIVDNDGRNALSMGKNPAAMRALWVQLKISELQTAGMRLKDMPEEMCAMPDKKDMDNALVASLAVFHANYLMDRHEFDRAEEVMAHLLSVKSAIPAIYKSLMACDRALCAVISGKNPEDMIRPEDKKVMRAMKTFPSVIRTEYVLALYGGDTKKAEKALRVFEKTAKSYPNAGDIESEREFMDIARDALTNKTPESIM